MLTLTKSQFLNLISQNRSLVLNNLQHAHTAGGSIGLNSLTVLYSFYAFALSLVTSDHIM